jgi:hypothetical protein
MVPKVVSVLVVVVFGVMASVVDAAGPTRGADRLTGAVAGAGIHPLFGTLPFTDGTVGESDGLTAQGGGLITFDFGGVGLGIVSVLYGYTCLSAERNVSTHRFVVLRSTNTTLAPVGATGLSSVIDRVGTPNPDTDRVLLFAPPPPPQGPCSREDRAILDTAPVISLSVTSGTWSVHDGLPGYP